MAKYSVIIPTLNEAEFLPDLLECLANQTLKDFEIIIADAGSADATVQIASAAGATVVDGGIPGLGRNSGASVARGEMLIFMDADVKFDPEFLAQSIQDFYESDFDLAIPLFDTDHEKFKYRILLRQGNGYKKIMRHTRFPDGTGQLVFIRREVFAELGGYNDWRVAEDTELFWRAAKQKYRVGVLKTKFYTSVRRYEKFGILWIFTIWGIIGMMIIFGLYNVKFLRQNVEKLYGSWGKW